MKKKLLIPILIGGVFFVSCSKEKLEPVGQKNLTEVQKLSVVPSLSLNKFWEEGATSMLNGAPHAAQTNTVTVWNNFVSAGRIGFQRWDQSVSANFGRTNGSGDNGEATHAFAYKVNAWTATVPFAFGNKGAKEAIWTPTFVNVGIAPVSMGLFVTDNSSGDENITSGIIEIGDWRAVQLNVLDNNNIDYRQRVSIEELVNGNWVQRVRTNNNNGIVVMRSFAVINVRTNYSISGGKVVSPITKTIPVLKSQIVGINNTISNGPIALWTLQKGGQVNYNDEMFRF